MCFLFNVRMNHYSFFSPTMTMFEFFELVCVYKSFWMSEKNWFLLLSKCLKRKSMSFAIKQQRRLMDILELLYTHIHIPDVDNTFACIILKSTRATTGFSLLFFHFVCLNSWKGLKNTKHLMMIKVVRMHTVFTLSVRHFQCVSVFCELKSKSP